MLEQFQNAIISKLDLSRWEQADTEQKKEFLSELFDFGKSTFGLSIQLRFTMPEGFELAFGLSNPATGDICINEAMWETCHPIEPLFTLLHELRHSIQSSHPELFSPEYELNSHYVIQFDGTGYKIDGDQIIAVKMNGEQGYFTDLYIASPCERDANAFAYQCLKAVCSDPYLDSYYEMWSPKFQYFREEDTLNEFMKAVAEIDRLVHEQA